MKPIVTWILIADGARARVLSHKGQGNGIHQIEGFDFREEPKSAQDIMTDKPGRVYDRSGGGRHSMEYRQDPAREEKKRFAGDLADFLDRYRQQKDYDRLIVIAAPKTLGDLRAVFSDLVEESVYHELAKDLTHIANDEIEKHLEEVLAV